MEDSAKTLVILGAGASMASAIPCIERVFGRFNFEDFFSVMKCMNEKNIHGKEYLIKRGWLPADLNSHPFPLFCFTDNDINQMKEAFRKCHINPEDNGSSLLLINKLVEDYYIGLDPVFSGYYNPIHLLYKMVASYYRRFDGELYKKLWEIVEKESLPVLSLNWDINFERVVYEYTKVEMKYFYGEAIFKNLVPVLQGNVFNPIVKILKPHGSLNFDIVKIEDSNMCFFSVENDLLKYNFGLNSNYSILIPPIQDESQIFELNNEEPLDEDDEKRKKIVGELFKEIKETLTPIERLIIIGYSFPDYDHHIKKLFEGCQITNIDLFDISCETYRNIKNAFPSPVEIEFHPKGFVDILNFQL